MKVSVAIPCYNQAAFIGGAIQSVLDQSRPADEVLVVDDGSTDDSAAIIEQYPVILVSHAENRGLSAARNTALERATGDVLVFIDGDGVADTDLVRVLLTGYEDNPRVAGVGGQGVEVRIHTVADRWRRAHASQGHGDTAIDVEFLYGLCMSFRTELLRSIGGFDVTLRTNAEDMDIGLRLTRAGYRLRYLPEARVYHQRTDDLRSLYTTMASWYKWAYVSRSRNDAQPWRLLFGTLRRLITDPLSDLIVARDYELARLSWQLGWVKLHALWQAAQGNTDD
jgi:glycosyltransferase involved in cell wall biosynthesis